MPKPFLTATLLALTASFATPMHAQDIPAEYQQVLSTLGKQGDFKDNVLKVNIPRNDVKVTVAGVATPTPFGFGGWVAMAKGDGGHQVLMGDLVLLQDEVNPVMSALLENGIDVTALHNHFFRDEPRMYYMHVHAHGTPAELAQKLKPALALIGKPTGNAAPAPAPAAAAPDALNAARLAEMVGAQGEQSGPVYKITLGRNDLKVVEMGATINARMGLNTWAAFTGTNEKAAVAGDVAMLESEVTPVLKALRKNGLDVVAIHHHMTADRPMIIFLHYWGTGPADKLAWGFKAAVTVLGKHGAATASRCPCASRWRAYRLDRCRTPFGIADSGPRLSSSPYGRVRRCCYWSRPCGWSQRRRRRPRSAPAQYRREWSSTGNSRKPPGNRRRRSRTSGKPIPTRVPRPPLVHASRSLRTGTRS